MASSTEVENSNIDIDDDVDEDDEMDDDEAPIIKQKGKRSRKVSSSLWDYFERKEGKNKKKIAKCKTCGKEYIASGTSNMKRHLLGCSKNDGLNMLTKFDYNVFREMVAMAVIEHDLPFNFVTWHRIKKLLRYFKPDLNIISRNTCKADCMKVYNREKSNVKSLLESTSSRISLTSNCWSSITTDGYICLTGHFLDKDWNIQKRILNFCNLPPPHNGVALCERIYSFLCGWKIENRIFSLTLDNASANDACVERLRNLLVSKGGLLNQGDFFHMRCSAHILNLIVQDGLKEIDDSIGKIRESVKYIKGSQARKVKFLECVSLCNLDAKKGLRQDVSTRWNSTFMMIDNVLYYQNAFVHLGLSDSNYKHCPLEDEWVKVEKISKFLRVFNDITHLFSGSKYVTANLYFPLVFSAHLTLKKNICSEHSYMSSMATRMMEKFKKYWSEYSRIMAIAVVLDPRYKLSFVDYCYKKLYGDVGQIEAGQVKFDLFSLFSKYVNVSSGSSGEVGISKHNAISNHNISPSIALDWEKEFDALNADELTHQKSELDLYLDEPRMDRKMDLDILSYWKGNQYRFPQVAAMARDVLAIPITTVASESAFSNSGRILDQFRSALKPDVVEALVCGKDWLHASYEIEVMEEKEREIRELDKEIMELCLDSNELNSTEDSSSFSI